HEHAARDECTDFLDTELRETGARGGALDRNAVVQAAVDALVREHVELRADLPELGRDELLVAHALVGAERSVRALRIEVEAAGRDRRNVTRKDAPQFDDFAG